MSKLVILKRQGNLSMMTCGIKIIYFHNQYQHLRNNKAVKSNIKDG